MGKTHPSPGVAHELGLAFPASLGADCRGHEVLSARKPPSTWLVGGTRSRPFLPELEQGREWLYRPGGEKDLARFLFGAPSPFPCLSTLLPDL